MKRFLVPLAGLILGAVGASATAAGSGRLGRDVVPTFQAVGLEVDADQTDYRGSVEILLDVRRAVGHFDLHAEDMTLESVSLEGASGSIDARYERLDSERIRIVPAEPLPPGGHTLRLGFEGRDFFSKEENQVSGTERALGRVAAEVNDCLALRAREGESVRRFLESTGS